ncbi:hypothetical protein GH714_020854 [Hevea brasiliensis]|uniref:Bet v I/Major latex protein domain-containing protein n=1 Tax=Hevea brasiliensis TaxID=3981 RepID=A0A6A6M302_HEVBR|nr:hypothetical protein GH714_020854 [Hevea brasiliensis]
MGVPATMVWDAYRGLVLGRLVDQLLGDDIGKVEVVQGDGSVVTLWSSTYLKEQLGIKLWSSAYLILDIKAMISLPSSYLAKRDYTYEFPWQDKHEGYSFATHLIVNPGTLCNWVILLGAPGIGYLKELFTKIDDDNRVKETEVIEGGCKDLGFDLFHICLEIIEKDAQSSIIMSTIEYNMDDTKAELASFVSIKQIEIIAETLGKYLIEKKSTT